VCRHRSIGRPQIADKARILALVDGLPSDARHIALAYLAAHVSAADEAGTPREICDCRRHQAVSERPVVLADGVVALRAWEPEDAQAVFTACQDPLIARFTPLPMPYTEDAARQFVFRGRAGWSNDEPSFAITDAATGAVVGSIARLRPSGHRAEFGYWLASPARGRGFATRALRLITAWTLETTDLIRLELFTHVENGASGRVAERAGYVREGLRRAWYLDRNGKPGDAFFYVRLREDG